MNRYLIRLVACSLAAAHCGQVPGLVEDLKDVQVVQAKIVITVNSPNVNVNLGNGKYLTVSLINSPLKDLAKGPKEATARDIAQVAYLAFPRRERLERVTVVFLVHRQYFFFFNYSDGTDVHFYDAKELEPSPNAKSSSIGAPGSAQP